MNDEMELKTAIKSTADKIEPTLQLLLLIGFLFTCVYAPLSQAYTWLKTGILPERDLYWLLSFLSDSPVQQITTIKNGEFVTVNHLEFTDWVGLNNILNGICDIHVGVLFILVVWMLIALKEYILD